VSTISPDVTAAFNNTITDLNSNASTEQIRQDENAFFAAANGGQVPGTANTLNAMQNMDRALADPSFDPNQWRQALTDAGIAYGITATPPPGMPSQPD
jgi:hypothetical protein